MTKEQQTPGSSKTKFQSIGFWLFIGGMVGMAVGMHNTVGVTIAGIMIIGAVIIQNRMNK
jgi:hypothetical protein